MQRLTRRHPLLFAAAAAGLLALLAPATASADDFDFDFFADPPAVETAPAFVDPTLPAAINTRRTMLQLHQLVGFGLVATELGSIVTGQLNYNDMFGDSGSTRFKGPHKGFTYATMGLALTSATLSLFAPVPIEKQGGFDRMTLHKIAMFTAFAGWATQLGLGLYTASRSGYADHQTFAQAHLAVGYVTLAGTLVGLGTVVF